jgi:hypothetical protein
MMIQSADAYDLPPYIPYNRPPPHINQRWLTEATAQHQRAVQAYLAACKAASDADWAVKLARNRLELAEVELRLAERDFADRRRDGAWS